MSKIPSSIWIVIPAFNEERYLAAVLTKISKFTSNIIVVDDGSRDGTVAIAETQAAYVLKHRLNLGKGAALKTGCDFAFDDLKAEAVIMMDGDDQHDPAELLDFTRELTAGHDLVLGVRSFSKEIPWIKRFANEMASHLVRIFFGRYIPDIPSGYKALSKSAYRTIAWQTTDYAVELEMAMRIAENRLPFKVIPIKTIYHDFDKGMTLLDTLSLLHQMLAYRMHL